MINDNKYHIIYPEFLLLEGVTWIAFSRHVIISERVSFINNNNNNNINNNNNNNNNDNNNNNNNMNENRHIFIKSYISNKTLPLYSKIHFRHCQELNDKNNLSYIAIKMKYANRMNSQKRKNIQIK